MIGSMQSSAMGDLQLGADVKQQLADQEKERKRKALAGLPQTSNAFGQGAASITDLLGVSRGGL